MQMINTVMNETPKFLDGKPNELDKVIVKRAYATYLNDNGFTPEQFENEPFNMSELLPALGKLDTKWKQVAPEMMRTTHTIVHRLKTIFNRFKDKPEHVHIVMQEVNNDHDLSGDFEPTVNPDPTDSEKSDDEPYQGVLTKFGLVDKPSEFGDPEEEDKSEEKEEKPWEQEAENKQEEAQILPQEFVEAAIQTEETSILQKRNRFEDQMITSDLGVYGPDLLAFLKARQVKKRAKTALKEAKTTYEQACSGLEQMRDNFNAAFESSEEPKE